MPHKMWVNKCRKAGLKITQLQGLIINLTEHEQEMIFGSGGRDDCWCLGVLNSVLQKSATISNFRIKIGDLN